MVSFFFSFFTSRVFTILCWFCFNTIRMRLSSECVPTLYTIEYGWMKNRLICLYYTLLYADTFVDDLKMKTNRLRMTINLCHDLRFDTKWNITYEMNPTSLRAHTDTANALTALNKKKRNQPHYDSDDLAPTFEFDVFHMILNSFFTSSSFVHTNFINKSKNCFKNVFLHHLNEIFICNLIAIIISHRMRFFIWTFAFWTLMSLKTQTVRYASYVIRFVALR